MVLQEAFEWQIALYLFLGGVGAGAILSAVIVDFYDREKYLAYIKGASLVGMPAVSIGCLFLLIDLGQGLKKPWLLIYLLSNPTSAITWGTAILSLFIFISLIYAAYNFNFIKFGGGTFVKIALILLCLGTGGYTGVLLGLLKAIPLWHQTALPILFIISAASTGISAAVIMKELFIKDKGELHMIETMHYYLLLIEFVIVFGMILIGLNGVPEMVYSMKLLLVGKYAFQFWSMFLILGLILPIIVYTFVESKKLHLSKKSIVLIEALVLLGGFYLRYLIIHAGAYTEKFVQYIGR
ncbi:molybdopterin oxidoreductase membrane subunit [Deferribacter desulfuricans SSM1]|uniref:Molybdopterin oxidoreductase membrane subunit n=1 Tax=Deferribacter desulfuricans (strain DSM 14783 / JCM 11476 / NBRC 101012 / SSM1) TaxID=639282 RepID=D3PC29_DEFDS|nr:NrfD/PsrC family molybdoenzyme membrane anchor subunit [Deferribacter desulfuricans]BAI80152.1 molybdopterin oxidoreductase membrane subunit [Deferribacter desulfuricans SSM1]